MRTGCNQGRLTGESAPTYCSLCLFGALFDSVGHLGNRHQGARYLIQQLVGVFFLCQRFRK